MKEKYLTQIKNGLIVSCQAEENSPFNSPEGVAMFAISAEQNGASAIRSEGIEKTKKIISAVNLPVVGLIKSKFDDGTVCITRSEKDIEDLLKINCMIIAVDGTARKKNNLSGPEFIHTIKKKYPAIVWADLSHESEAAPCIEAGADIVSSTLNGYTPQTLNDKKYSPNFSIVDKMLKTSSVPVIAEGRINTPEDAAKMIQLGAWAVVVGTAITRPGIITSWFYDAIKKFTITKK